MKLLQDILSKKYNYKKLPKDIEDIQEVYLETIPQFLLKTSSMPLYTVSGTLVCNEFDRIVIGDYGAFVEFSREQANKDSFIIAPGQEYRLEPQYSNAKYIWLTIPDDSNIKIYYQKHKVKYADYQPGKYYVSVYEVYPEGIKQLYKE